MIDLRRINNTLCTIRLVTICRYANIKTVHTAKKILNEEFFETLPFNAKRLARGRKVREEIASL
jgi:hypothetical protein